MLRQNIIKVPTWSFCLPGVDAQIQDVPANIKVTNVRATTIFKFENGP